MYLNAWIQNETKGEKRKNKKLSHCWEMLVNQLIILKTSKWKEKNQTYILAFLCKLYHWETK